MELSWEDGGPVHVERQQKKGWRVLTDTAESPWRDTKVNCGKTYTYRVRWRSGQVWAGPQTIKVPKW